ARPNVQFSCRNAVSVAPTSTCPGGQEVIASTALCTNVCSTPAYPSRTARSVPRSPAATTGLFTKCSKLTSHSHDRSSPSGTWPLTEITTEPASVSTIDSASCQPAGFLASSMRTECAPNCTVLYRPATSSTPDTAATAAAGSAPS